MAKEMAGIATLLYGSAPLAANNYLSPPYFNFMKGAEFHPHHNISPVPWRRSGMNAREKADLQRPVFTGDCLHYTGYCTGVFRARYCGQYETAGRCVHQSH
jgi:hypothetical protein